MSEELQGSEVAEGLVRAHGVVVSLPSLEFAIEFSEGERKGGDLIELLGMGAVGALDLAVELGGAGREDKELDASSLAGPFEDGGELAAPVDLQGTQGKGQAALEGVEEQLSGRRRLPGRGLRGHPSARSYHER